MYTKSVRECYARVRVRIALKIFWKTISGKKVHFLVSVIFFSIPQTRITYQTVFKYKLIGIGLRLHLQSWSMARTKQLRHREDKK